MTLPWYACSSVFSMVGHASCIQPMLMLESHIEMALAAQVLWLQSSAGAVQSVKLSGVQQRMLTFDQARG